MHKASNTTADLPLIAAPFGFTLPTRRKRFEFLTLEVIEDRQPSPLPYASCNDPRTTIPEDADPRLSRELAVKQDDSFEADLQLEAELAEGLANLDTPVPGPSRQQQSPTPDVADSATSVFMSARPPVHLEFEVVKGPSPTRTSVKGKGKIVGKKPEEMPHNPIKRANLPRVSSTIEGPPTRKSTISFKEKAAELARTTGRLFTPSKPLLPPIPTANPPLSLTGRTSSVPRRPPLPRVQAASGSPTSQLFTSKGFSRRVQDFRNRQTEDNLRQFHERYGGIIVEHARRDLTNLMSTNIPIGSSGAPRSTKPNQRRQMQRGKRITRAQAQAEEVMKICRSTKSYIVDMAAFKSREAPTIPEPQHPTISSSLLSSIQPEKMVLSQEVSKARSPAPLGSIPRGLKFTREQKPVLDSREVATEAVGRVTSSDRETRGQIFVSANRDNGSLTVDASKRRREKSERELEGSSPRKRPRLGGH